MIRLTEKIDNNHWYVSPDKIVDVQLNGKLTIVYTVTGNKLVVESPEEVVRKVLEYRLIVEDYKQSNGEYRILFQRALEELAGLWKQE